MIRVFAGALLTVAALASGQSWPTSDLREYVDYREPSAFASLSGKADEFADVPYPRGILFSTQTGSLYWYDDVSHDVTCLIPMNGVVTGLSMSIDRKVYAFTLNGTPYLWRIGTRPGVFLTELDFPSVTRNGGKNSLEVNALGTAAILKTRYDSPDETWYRYALIDLKTLTAMKSFGMHTTGFTPNGRYVVVGEYDYEHADDNGDAPFVWKALGLDGKTPRVRVDGDPEVKLKSERTVSYYGWGEKAPDWYQYRKTPYRVSSDASWEELGLPDSAVPELPPGVHRADSDDGLEITAGDQVRELSREGDSSAGRQTWTRKMREYGSGNPYDRDEDNSSNSDIWLDASGNRLLLLMTRPGPADGHGYATYRMVLRFLDWKTGDKVGDDIELNADATSITEWVPGQYVALHIKGGGRLEYWFKTKAFLSGNGTTAFRGRPITSFYPSRNGSLTYDKAGTPFTMTRFKEQIGGVTGIAVRDDQKLVAEIDEGGQLAIRRVADGKVLAITTLGDSAVVRASFDSIPSGEIQAAPPTVSASAWYPSAALPLQVSPYFAADDEK